MAQETPYRLEEIDARLDESERDIEEGRYYTTEEVFSDVWDTRREPKAVAKGL